MRYHDHCSLRHDIDCKPGARWWKQLCVDREVRLNIRLAVDRMTSVKGWKSLPCMQTSVDWDPGDTVNQINTSRSWQRGDQAMDWGTDIELLGSRPGPQETGHAPAHPSVPDATLRHIAASVLLVLGTGCMRSLTGAWRCKRGRNPSCSR